MRYLLFLLLISITATAQTDSAHKKSTVFQYVEQMPEAPYDIYHFLADSLRYPEEARENDIEGKLFVKFIVNQDGTLDSIHISKSILVTYDRKTKQEHSQEVAKIGYGLEEEALRVIHLLAPWKPGTQQGVPVRVYFTLPLVFKLQ